MPASIVTSEAVAPGSIVVVSMSAPFLRVSLLGGHRLAGCPVSIRHLDLDLLKFVNGVDEVIGKNA